MNDSKIYLKTNYDKIKSLIADDSKNSAMLDELLSTLRQLRAKNTFRLALLNQIRESMEESIKGDNK